MFLNSVVEHWSLLLMFMSCSIVVDKLQPNVDKISRDGRSLDVDEM